MKVLHLLTNISSQISVTVQALRRCGVDARGLVQGNAAIQDPRGLEVLKAPLSRREYPVRGWLQRWVSRKTILDAIRWADIVHWHYSWGLSKAYDVEYAASLGKPGVVEFWGSDIRLPRIAASDNPYMARMYRQFPDIECKNDELSPKAQALFKRCGVACLVPDPELRSYVSPDLFPKPYLTRQRVLLDEYLPSYPAPENHTPLVVHMPSHKAFKGTDAIVAAVAELKKKYVFEFRLVHGVRREDALRILRSCDVCLDQFVLGGHGLALVESMAFGKPTLCFIKPSLVPLYPSDFPVVNANQDNLIEVLGKLLEDGHRRHEVGVQSRAYVEKYHDSGVIAKQLVGIYEELIDRRKKQC